MTICTPKRPLINYPRFNYSGLNEQRPVIHTVETCGDRIEVVGDGDNGCYEWVIWQREKVGAVHRITQHSDDGYGCSGIALRDGLIVYHGGAADGDELLDQWVQAQRKEHC